MHPTGLKEAGEVWENYYTGMDEVWKRYRRSLGEVSEKYGAPSGNCSQKIENLRIVGVSCRSYSAVFRTGYPKALM